MEYFDEICKELKKIDILVDCKNLKSFLDLSESDQRIVVSKVKKLVRLISETEKDYEAKRDSYRLLSKLDDENILSCFTNNKNYIDKIKDRLSPYERITLCLDAALMGSIEVAETLFDNKNCNPRKNTYLISYAMCSGENGWVKLLINKWEVDIIDPEYCFLNYAELLKNDSLKNYYENRKENSISSNKSSFFPAKSSSSVSRLDSQIKGELLESFDELILGELEMLSDIKEESIKNFLVDAIFDSTLSTLEVAKYAFAIDPFIGKRLAILFCCLYPKKWEEPFIKEFKDSVIDSYVKRSLNEEDKKNDFSIYERRVNWLKIYANNLVRRFFKEREISAIKLTSNKLTEKEETLNIIRNNAAELSIEVESIEREKKLIEDIIKDENNSGVVHRSISTQPSSLFKAYNQVPIEHEAWKKLSLSDSRWKKIFDLIKYKPKGVGERSEQKMLRILSAILYKEENGCRWRELPQMFPPESMVRHYYYEWKNDNKLKDIKNMFKATQSTTESKNVRNF